MLIKSSSDLLYEIRFRELTRMVQKPSDLNKKNPNSSAWFWTHDRKRLFSGIYRNLNQIRIGGESSYLPPMEDRFSCLPITSGTILIKHQPIWSLDYKLICLIFNDYEPRDLLSWSEIFTDTYS